MSMAWDHMMERRRNRLSDSQPLTWATLDWRVFKWWLAAAGVCVVVWGLVGVVGVMWRMGVLPWQH